MRCACSSVFRLDGNEADTYANEHLIEVAVDSVEWTVTYRCPETGRRWLRDSPQSHLRGGGPPRLRQETSAGHIIDSPSVDPYA